MAAGDHLGQQFVQHAFDAYGMRPKFRENYELTTMPTEELKHQVMKDPEIREDHGDFDTYHRWYMKGGGVPKHTERWPVILAPEGNQEAIEDGWHRFHSYVEQGDKEIPVLKPKPGVW